MGLLACKALIHSQGIEIIVNTIIQNEKGLTAFYVKENSEVLLCGAEVL